MFGNLGYQSMRSTERSVDALSRLIENISNVNSLGYKRSKLSFTETLEGEMMKYESREFSQGPLRKTGDVFDFALNGPGFFEVELPSGQRAYTRAGRFSLNNEGELVTAEGYRVIPKVEDMSNPTVAVNKDSKGGLDLNIKVTTPKLTISPEITPDVQEDGTINGVNPDTGDKTKIGKLNVVVFNNSEGLESLGRGYFLPTKSSGQVQDIEAGPDSPTKVKQGYVEYGNVDMAAEFMNLTEIRNMLNANFKILKVVDKLYEQVHYTISRSV